MNSTNTTSVASANPLSVALSSADYTVYYVIMLLILTTGIPGNIMSIIVLYHKDHRNKVASPLLINIAAADLLIIVFGYPVAIISTNMTGNVRESNSLRCSWSALINATTGITAIASHVYISVLVYCRITHTGMCRRMLSAFQFWLVVASTWLYGIVLASPPFFGWNKFIPHTSHLSCGPDWMSRDPNDIAYIIYLVILGYFLPLFIISTYYFKIYRYIHTHNVPQSTAIQEQRRKDEIRTLRMLVITLFAFILSWTPYCILSLIATCNGYYRTSISVNLASELAAKASVVYNPVVFVLANKRFRSTLRNSNLYISFRNCVGGLWPVGSNDQSESHGLAELTQTQNSSQGILASSEEIC